MSYGFSVLAASKEEAKEMVSAEMAKVAAAQPIHADDRFQAEAAAHAFIDILPDDDAQDVKVNVSGYLQWAGVFNVDHSLTAANLTIGAQLVAREVAQAA